MSKDKLKQLFEKYTNGSLSKQELEELLHALRTTDEGELDKIIDGFDHQSIFVHNENQNEFDEQEVYNKIQETIRKDLKPKRRKVFITRWYAAAAVIMVLISISLLIIKKQYKPNLLAETSEIQLPDPNMAIVTLSDGRQLTISETDSKVLQEEGIEVIRTSDGLVRYKITAINHSKISYQTFRSPKGVSSTLELTDGSIVWLNSGAEISYPTKFTKDERRVSLTGEGYFHVKHHDKKPFIVTANGTDVKVLGTEFNISSIVGEVNLTTLVSGSVEIYTNNKKVLLTPGLQATTSKFSKTIEVNKVDLKEVLAWKNGYFRFTNDDIRTVLEKIKTWYDIEEIEIISYTDDRFTGSIERTSKLSDLLAQLEKTSNYKFKIIEGRVVVMK